MTKSLAACCALLAVLLTGCNWTLNATEQLGRYGPAQLYVGALALSTPPVNTIVFGPCREEFGMPDSRRANCELHYRLVSPVTGQPEAPWEQRAKAYAATAYQPGELTCWRTLGQISECAVVNGPPRVAPYIAAPNTLGSE
jgi:hypothetical protein